MREANQLNSFFQPLILFYCIFCVSFHFILADFAVPTNPRAGHINRRVDRSINTVILRSYYSGRSRSARTCKCLS